MKAKIIISIFIVNWVLLSIYPYVKFRWDRQKVFESFTESKEYIPESKMLTFTFPASYKISWEKEGREFEFEGKMYDVVETQKTATSLIVKCVPDHEEDGLIYNYSKARRTKNKQKLKYPKVKHFIEKGVTFCFARYSETIVSNENRTILNSLFLPIPSPPPESLLILRKSA